MLLVDFLDCGDTAAIQLYCGTLLLHQDTTLTATSGPIRPTGLLIGYDAMAGRLWATHTTFLTSCLVISTPFGPPEKHLAVKCLQHVPAQSKLSPSGYRHLTPVLSRLHYEPWCHAGRCFSAGDDYMKV